MRRRVKKRFRDGAPPVLTVLLFLLVWEAGVRLTGIERWLLPAPSGIAASFADSWELIQRHTWPTLQEAVLGFLLGIGVALLLAVLIQLSAWLRRGIYPLLIGSQTVPIIAVAPLLILWFGYGLLPKVLIVALVTFFPVVVSTVDGLSSADPDMVRLLRSMGAKEWQVFRMVRFPHALPSFFSGMKIAATYGVLGAVIAEWLGASEGLGVFLIRSQNSFAADRVFVAITVITFWSLVLFGLVCLAARWAAPWAYLRKEDSWKGEEKR
ncbi:ABC-type nitrate/sulfonate/bicarbonate transport system permease component [Melghirimyces profundicolus]|uniref:ABC-type nitrate/sulfonate/bicarbonate transport system permease component n=1 Tax=Melghirimyces profundicolus TaxID=1242148 RepID=A0A2T6C7M6_9BACL|nr:ABC transporter permease [Melghirimyces profundicolus]PTX64329.1 ABC-type nitrate/sulfonate/bicarbonate transport system permease component [Melghirimyces profundicolus]